MSAARDRAIEAAEGARRAARAAGEDSALDARTHRLLRSAYTKLGGVLGDLREGLLEAAGLTVDSLVADLDDCAADLSAEEAAIVGFLVAQATRLAGEIAAALDEAEAW